MRSDKRAIVVGAGLVGSLWAVFLAKRGYEVEVYDRRSDFRKADFIGGRSINLAMSDRGWKAVEKAGIKEAISKVAIPMPGRMMHSTEGELTFQPYGKQGQAIYSVSRGGLNLELVRIADRYENVHFHFDKRCEEVDFEKNRIIFKDEVSGETEEVEAPLIFGADGAFSAVRWSLQKTPGFNYSQQYLEHGYKELCIPPAGEGKHRIKKNALHIWPRGHFMLIALPNADGSFTCTLFLPFKGEVSFEQLEKDENILAFFREYFPDAMAHMPELLSDFRQNPTSTLVTIRCSPWQYNKRILLLGDASHAIVPFYGQGMNAGFEDCTILDELIDEYQENWDKIIPAFSASRKKDGDAIADLALRNFVEMRDQVGDPRFLLRKKIEAWLHEQFPDDFLPVYSMVTFSHISYSEALEESRAQDDLFRRIFALKNIEDNWVGEATVEVFKNWLKNHKKMV